ncbi:MAG TPA: zinc ribbon domain-containing protein [bacterium]|nr:zinc ribbon domain-containing protein [bacterium]
MALIQCTECRKEISQKAYVCPHCGFVARQSFFTLMLILLLSTMFFVVLDKVIDVYLAITKHFL